MELPIATPVTKAKKTEEDSETKTMSFKPSSQRKSAWKKAKESSLESEEEEESTAKDTVSSGGDQES